MKAFALICYIFTSASHLAFKVSYPVIHLFFSCFFLFPVILQLAVDFHVRYSPLSCSRSGLSYCGVEEERRRLTFSWDYLSLLRMQISYELTESLGKFGPESY
ncbi:hypothetical protein ACMFMG_001225 [Clarireedia jacksonii]